MSSKNPIAKLSKQRIIQWGELERVLTIEIENHQPK